MQWKTRVTLKNTRYINVINIYKLHLKICKLNKYSNNGHNLKQLTYEKGEKPKSKRTFIKFEKIWKISQNCRDPPHDTWHTPLSRSTLFVPLRGYVARLLFGATLPVPPKRTRGAHLYSGPPRGAHDTLKYHTRAMLYPIRIYCPDHWLQGAVTAHVPLLAERKDKGDGKSPPTSYDSWLQGDDDFVTILRTSWQAKKYFHY